jgi:hypothetical protein
VLAAFSRPILCFHYLRFSPDFIDSIWQCIEMLWNFFGISFGSGYDLSFCKVCSHDTEQQQVSQKFAAFFWQSTGLHSFILWIH